MKPQGQRSRLHSPQCWRAAGAPSLLPECLLRFTLAVPSVGKSPSPPGLPGKLPKCPLRQLNQHLLLEPSQTTPGEAGCQGPLKAPRLRLLPHSHPSHYLSLNCEAQGQCLCLVHLCVFSGEHTARCSADLHKHSGILSCRGAGGGQIGEGRRPPEAHGRAQRALGFPGFPPVREKALRGFGPFPGVFQSTVWRGATRGTTSHWVSPYPHTWWHWPLGLSPGKGSTRWSSGPSEGQEGTCLGPRRDLWHCDSWAGSVLPCVGGTVPVSQPHMQVMPLPQVQLDADWLILHRIYLNFSLGPVGDWELQQAGHRAGLRAPKQQVRGELRAERARQNRSQAERPQAPDVRVIPLM